MFWKLFADANNLQNSIGTGKKSEKVNPLHDKFRSTIKLFFKLYWVLVKFELFENSQD